MFENPRRGRQAINFTKKVPKILDFRSSSEQIFSENWRWVPQFKPFLSALGVVSKWFHSEFIHHHTIDWTYKYTASRGWSWTVQFTRTFVFVKKTNHGKQFCNENRIRILLTSNSLNRSVMGQSCSTVLHTDCQADSQTEVRYLHDSFTWWKQTVIFVQFVLVVFSILRYFFFYFILTFNDYLCQWHILPKLGLKINLKWLGWGFLKMLEQKTRMVKVTLKNI